MPPLDSRLSTPTRSPPSLELALTEACANVIDHSGPGDANEVVVTEMADLDAEHGRGVALMHALVDQVRFESRPERGTIVHLVKRLDFDDTIPPAN